MKKLIGCLLGVCLAVSAQAVTVTWTVPTGDWTSEASVYFVYSTTQVSDYASLYSNTKSLADGETSGDYTRFGGFKVGDDKVSGTAADLTATTAGYYYLMVFSSSDNSLYAVGGGKQYNADGSTGIYNEAEVDGTTKPDIGTYVDMGGFIGGTWTAAIVPEPTLLSLLAFGVAGLALRRKYR